MAAQVHYSAGDSIQIQRPGTAARRVGHRVFSLGISQKATPRDVTLAQLPGSIQSNDLFDIHLPLYPRPSVIDRDSFSPAILRRHVEFLQQNRVDAQSHIK